MEFGLSHNLFPFWNPRNPCGWVRFLLARYDNRPSFSMWQRRHSHSHWFKSLEYWWFLQDKSNGGFFLQHSHKTGLGFLRYTHSWRALYPTLSSFQLGFFSANLLSLLCVRISFGVSSLIHCRQSPVLLGLFLCLSQSNLPHRLHFILLFYSFPNCLSSNKGHISTQFFRELKYLVAALTFKLPVVHFSPSLL